MCGGCGVAAVVGVIHHLNKERGVLPVKVPRIFFDVLFPHVKPNQKDLAFSNIASLGFYLSFYAQSQFLLPLRCLHTAAMYLVVRNF